MKTSDKGIELIKQFEGLQLMAYKPLPSEKYFTIGYGHNGPDVKAGARITSIQAENILKIDLKRYERAVLKIRNDWTQGQFDALVSFAYNCGEKNLSQLCAGRSPQQIADALLKYNKAGGKVLEGLNKRRVAERKLFMQSVDHTENIKRLQALINDLGYKPALVCDGVIGTKTKNGLIWAFGVTI